MTRSNMRASLLLVAVAAIVASLVLPGCYLSRRLGDDGPGGGTDRDGGTDLEDGGDGGRRPIPDSPEAVRATCDEGPILVDEQVVDFPAIQVGCPWGNFGNVFPVNLRATARRSQIQPLSLPGGAVICGFSLDFLPEEGADQPFLQYDDNFVLLFGDVVLAASDRSMVERLDRVGDLPIWDWNRVVDERMRFGDAVPFCLGEDEGLAPICEIPQTETRGPIRFRFADELVDQLSFRAIERGDFQFEFVAIGDDNPEIDCAHEAFSFRVDTRYTPL
jgi:hypothetical protein